MEYGIQNIPGGGGLEYQNVTTIHPVALIAVILFGTIMLFLPRRKVIWPLITITCFISSVQKISILGIDFDILRIITLFGLIRLIWRKEYRGIKFITLDKLLIVWCLCLTCIYVIQQGTPAAFINRLGLTFDAIGMYYLFRCSIRSWDDIDSIIQFIFAISIPVAIFFLIESQTGRNLFSFMGGIPEFTIIREGRLRCQGPFTHPILAGIFWASLLPLIYSFLWKHKNMAWVIFGVSFSVFTVISTNSSTSLSAMLCVIFGGLFYYFRNHMKSIRYGIIVILICLHIIMKRPVWGLIAFGSSLGGGTAWFRYAIVDAFIHHMSEWAVFGTKSTEHWFVGAQDVCNNYIVQGIQGGLLTLCIFLSIILCAFSYVGTLLKSVSDRFRMKLFWAMGVSLLVHCAGFFGVSYFGQICVLWYLLLAMIGSMYQNQCHDIYIRNIQYVKYK